MPHDVLSSPEHTSKLSTPLLSSQCRLTRELMGRLCPSHAGSTLYRTAMHERALPSPQEVPGATSRATVSGQEHRTAHRHLGSALRNVSCPCCTQCSATAVRGRSDEPKCSWPRPSWQHHACRAAHMCQIDSHVQGSSSSKPYSSHNTMPSMCGICGTREANTKW